jgi:tRNA(Arg) A34 adenosine deaminase TadA
MDALLSATRRGVPTIGTRMFVTTFPCHYCARHLVAAGVDEVQYIEPYPKSQALELHKDSIQIEATGWTPPSQKNTKQQASKPKVWFHPFSGVAPRMYHRAFIKDRDLKDDLTGEVKFGSPAWGTQWDVRRISYVQLEAELAKDATNGK